MKPEEQEQVNRWAKVYDFPPEEEAEIEEDGLGAARGLWYAMRLVGGIILLVVWASRTIALMRDGSWEPTFLATVFLLTGAAAFRYMELNYPKGKLTALGVSVACLALGIGFLA